MRLLRACKLKTGFVAAITAERIAAIFLVERAAALSAAGSAGFVGRAEAGTVVVASEG